MRRFRLALPSPRRRTSLVTRALGLGLVVVLACNEGGSGPDPNAPTVLRVQINVTGGTPDSDGYVVLVDGQPHGTTASTLTLQGMLRGSHQVALQGIAANCTLAGAPVREVMLPSASYFSVTFDITCYSTTGIQVATITNGVDAGAEYTVNLTDVGDRSLGVNAVLLIDRLLPGRYTVTLKLDPALTNCQVGGTGVARVVDVTDRVVVPVSYTVTCVAKFGVIRAQLQTTGHDADPSRYLASVDDGTPRRFLATGMVSFDSIPGGDHIVRVSGGSDNCALTGNNQAIASVSVGSLARQFAQVSFSAACVALERRIAFTRYPFGPPHWGYDPIISLTSDAGIVPLELAGGIEPSWSPDGLRIAFVSIPQSCYYGCAPNGIHVVTRDGTGEVALTSHGGDSGPAWSPNGAKIAFGRNGSIMVMNSDGSSQTQVPIPIPQNWSPDWSPDGTRLAFSCLVDPGNDDICLVNVDGTGFVRLTTSAARDLTPSWHPDGTRLVFATTQFTGNAFALAVMNTDGTGVRQVTLGERPAWSPDGTRIYFSRQGGLYSIMSDGSDLRLILANSTGTNYAPSVRP